MRQSYTTCCSEFSDFDSGRISAKSFLNSRSRRGRDCDVYTHLNVNRSALRHANRASHYNAHADSHSRTVCNANAVTNDHSLSDRYRNAGTSAYRYTNLSADGGSDGNSHGDSNASPDPCQRGYRESCALRPQEMGGACSRKKQLCRV